MNIPKIGREIKMFFSRMETADKLVVLVLIFSFLIRIIFLFYPIIRGWDETVYLNLGHDLSKNPLVYSLIKSGWSDFIPSTDAIYGWPNIGFRAPLLPYFLSFFYALNLDFLIQIIIPFFATASVFLLYVLGKDLFNKKVGLYSAILFSLIPVHVYFSGQVLTDTFVVFFILLTFISFWKGYEKGDKKYKVFFGLFFALSILARYTTLWIGPIFILYFLIRDRSLKFIKDRYLWYATGIFFLILSPLFIYSFKYYGNILGSFIYGFKAATYYGGAQSWSFFFKDLWQISSIIGIIFIISLSYVFIKRDFIKKEIYLLIIWTFFFLGIAMIMPHKEDRYIMSIIPAICLISGLFIDKLKKYKNPFLGIVFLILIVSLVGLFKNEYEKSQNKANLCFMEGNKFLANSSIEKNALVITNQSPIVYYYTQKENHLYPDPWSIASLKRNINLNYKDRAIYIFFSNYDMPINSPIKKDLSSNFGKVFECSKDWGYSVVYKYK